ncbi:MAG: 16S rRNA (guanine(527)-N(7))-methyltransferase RsmG [Alphaproteobacteria bacterium]|nr:16S rRNA (guanine(527)-N(7))-methyltransferase RsmG [Alphaproteobacteria bacterium]
MRPEEFQQLTRVSHETMEKLRIYHDLLLKWQKAVNLVSPGTLEDAWGRHFADSAQILDFLPPAPTKAVLADLGSGAGFPGLVLALLRPDLEVHLIESDERKGQFLKTVSRETRACTLVHTQRIEAMGADISPDIATARALAPLETLLGYCAPWAEKKPDMAMIFLKGRTAAEEIAMARKSWHFDHRLVESAHGDGYVVVVRNLRG